MKKKIFTLMTLLVCLCTGAWGTETVLSPTDGVTTVSTSSTTAAYDENATTWTINQGGISGGKIGRYAGPYCLVKFDASAIEGTITSAKLSFDYASSAYNTSYNVYLLGAADWTTSTVTWSSLSDDAKTCSATMGSGTWSTKSTTGTIEYDVLSTISKSLMGIAICCNTGREQVISNIKLTIESTTANIYSYTVNAVDNSSNLLKVVASGSDEEGATVTYAYPRYINVNGTLYMKDKQSTNPHYQGSFTLSTNEKVENITYTESSHTNVLFFTEAEDISEMTTITTENVKNRCSGLAGARTTSATTIYSLPAGTYKVVFATYASTGKDFIVYKNSATEENKLYNHVGSGGWNEFESDSFTLTEKANILITGGDSNYAMDYIFLKGTTDHETVGAYDCSTGWAGAYNSTPITIKAGETANYSIINYNSGSGNVWNNWYLFAKATASTDADNLFDVRADQYTDGDVTQTNTLSDFNYISDYNGATVNIEVKLTDAGDGTYTLTSTTTIQKADGTDVSGSKIDTKTGLTQSTLYLYMSVNNSWLELLSQGTTAVSAPITSSTGYATFSSTHALDFTDVEDLTAYRASVCDGANVTLVPVTGKVVANTGLVIKGATASIPVAATGEDVGTNLLYPCDGSWTELTKSDTGTNYVLTEQNSKAVFAPIDGTAATLRAGTAYLYVPSGDAHALNIVFEDGSETTSINSVQSSESKVQSEVYNLAGQRVAQPTKGLYIVNGKKVVIK